MAKYVVKTKHDFFAGSAEKCVSIAVAEAESAESAMNKQRMKWNVLGCKVYAQSVQKVSE